MFQDNLVIFTEKILTKRKESKERFLSLRKKRSFVVNFFLDLFEIVILVFFINLYLLQAYKVPTGSMLPTIQLKDSMFVDKLTLGPQILPGFGKLPNITSPKKDEIIVFENPEYEKRGKFFGTLNMLVYLLTFSFVNLDVDQSGNIRAQLLVKRNIASEGDRIKYSPKDGTFKFKVSGSMKWIDEEEYQKMRNFFYPIQRLNKKEDFDFTSLTAKNDVLESRNANYAPFNVFKNKELTRFSSMDIKGSFGLAYNISYYNFLKKINPQDLSNLRQKSFYEYGWYIPKDYIFPIGDNRDNSKDGRYFGSVSIKRIIGHPLFRFFPLNRIGFVK